jgi:S-adenosylmethionine-diacylglycerol 3-amino-3-carboxypropyl transferase
MKNELLSDAVHANPLASKQGMLERLFTLAFSGLVYPQIWEDPDVDMAALRLGPGKRLVTIASGGCNVMSYLTADPEHITAVDLNPAHVALLNLKLTAIRELPGYEPFFRFFGHADEKANVALYDRHLADKIDPVTRAYWEKRRLFSGRRIRMFARNVYQYGLLGRFISVTHLVARAYGKNPRKMMNATSLEEQRRLFEETLAPVFDTKLVRALCRMPVSLYGLGIPPAQFAYLNAASGGDMAGLLRGRLERLACDFPLEDNYFAWQAFGRSYDRDGRRAVPPYLRRDAYERVRDNSRRVAVKHASMTDHLASEDAASLDGYVLLDAQDWMSAEQMTELWVEITRTARPGARVIFRTAGAESPLETALPADLIDRWAYDAEASREGTARDRSSIYGAFHLYVLKD